MQPIPILVALFAGGLSMDDDPVARRIEELGKKYRIRVRTAAENVEIAVKDAIEEVRDDVRSMVEFWRADIEGNLPPKPPRSPLAKQAEESIHDLRGLWKRFEQRMDKAPEDWVEWRRGMKNFAKDLQRWGKRVRQRRHARMKALRQELHRWLTPDR